MKPSSEKAINLKSKKNSYIPSEAELEWYRKHPEQLEKYADSNKNYTKYLLSAFVTGFVLTVFSKVLIKVQMPVSEEMKVFIMDFLYDLGVSIWGSVVAIYLLEVSVEKRERKIRDWYDAVKQNLDA